MQRNPKSTTITSPPIDLSESRDLRLLIVASPDESTVGHEIDPPQEGCVIQRGRRTRGVRLSGRHEVIIDDPRMSAKEGHCRIVRDRRLDTLLVEDMSSKNGTFVNGIRITSAFLKPHDVVRVGDTLAVYCEHVEERCWSDPALPEILGHSKAMSEIREGIRKGALFMGSILIHGETGTGKELVARGLHHLSSHRGPFVGINCSAIPRDLFESELFGYARGAHSVAHQPKEGLITSAHGGTLFLDEIGEMPTDLQAKLLRVIEYREVMPLGATKVSHVDIKVIAATQVDLEAEVERGGFRRDLLYRVKELMLTIPPLCERREDIVGMWTSFLRSTCEVALSTQSSDLLEALLIYDWPGNVRELKSMSRRMDLALEAGQGMTLRILPPAIVSSYLARRRDTARAFDDTRGRIAPEQALPERKDRPPRELLVSLLKRHEGNISHIAKLLARSRQQVYRWLDDYGIDPADFR